MPSLAFTTPVELISLATPLNARPRHSMRCCCPNEVTIPLPSPPFPPPPLAAATLDAYLMCLLLLPLLPPL
jgi:hypothetical protein